MVAASWRDALRLSTPKMVDSVGIATAIISAASASTTMISIIVVPRCALA